MFSSSLIAIGFKRKQIAEDKGGVVIDGRSEFRGGQTLYIDLQSFSINNKAMSKF